MNESCFTRENTQKKYFVLACEVLHREICYCAAKSPNIIDIEFVSQGYHDLESNEMSKRLQQRINAVLHDKYDAVLLGFALCNNGISGIKAEKIPLVIPRAHDCITLLLGSKKKYDAVFAESPGSYFLSSGWIERDSDNLEKMDNTVMSKLGLDLSYQQYCEKYGAENAEFIMQALEGGLKYYEKIIFINNNLGNICEYRKLATEEAQKRNLKFQVVEGSFGLLQNLLDGNWNENEFLILQPGSVVVPSADENIIKSA